MLTCTDCNKPSSKTGFRVLRLHVDGHEKIVHICWECFDKHKYDWVREEDGESVIDAPQLGE